MTTQLSTLTIGKRLSLIVAVAVLSIGAVLTIQGAQFRDRLLEDKRDKTRELVETAHSAIAHFYRLAENGTLEPAAAKRQALAALKDIRYSEKEYFWVNDLSPRMVMHPYKPELDGKDLSQSKDPNGKRLFMEMVRVAHGSDGGFVDYYWPQPGQDQPVPKLSYVKEFAPWEWIVGSGIYIDDVEAETRRTVWRSLSIGGAIALLLVVVSTVLARSITRPLRRTIAALNDAAHGDGDLTRRLDDSGHDETAELGRAFNTFVTKIQSMLADIATSAEHLATTASVVTEVSVTTSRSLNHQQGETDQVATAVTEMSQTAQNMAESAAHAADAVHRVEAQTSEGMRTIGTNLESISTLNDTVEKAATRIENLSSESERIGAILDTIRAIAGQTNLLALNAAIEAARAGEQGRGFAVVADEVRTLAARTTSATTEIEEMIGALQQGAIEATRAMKEGQRGAQESLESAESAHRTLAAIREAVATIDDLNTQIASAAQEQAAVADEITQHVVSITTIAGETSAGAARTEESATAMDRHVGELRRLIRQFRLT